MRKVLKAKSIVNGLNLFYNEFKKYKSMMDYLGSTRTYMGHQIRERDELREKLVRKTGVFKQLIIELTEKQYFTVDTKTYDMWNEAFNPSSELPSQTVLGAIAFCVNSVNEAIGKLEDDIEADIRDEQGNLATNTKGIALSGPATSFELFDAMQFHPKVVEVSRKLFEDGHYRDAIYRAFVEINNSVKSKANSQLDGKKLMSTVFSLEKPIIKLNSLQTQSDRDHQEGFMFLFMGAMEGIRNPKAHENIIQNDPNRTLEYLAFASMLFKQLDKRIQKPPKGVTS
jgi:uncharacterized protein (TIGR02391 family)